MTKFARVKELVIAALTEDMQRAQWPEQQEQFNKQRESARRCQSWNCLTTLATRHSLIDACANRCLPEEV